MSTVSSLTGPNSFYRLEGEEALDPSVPEGSKEIESKPVNEDAKAAGVRMPEGTAKGSKKSVSEIIKSLSACLPAEEEPLAMRVWDVHKDAEAIAPKLEGMHLLEEYSKEELKDWMFAQIKSANTEDLNALMRGMLALNENWPFFDEIQALQECVVGQRESPPLESPYNRVEGNLLIRAIQKNALPEGWIKTTFATFEGWIRLSHWLSFFIRLDESKIKKYAKEFHFSLYFDSSRAFFFNNLDVILSAFIGNENKLPLFLSSFEGEIQSDVLSVLFHHDAFSERIKKECFDVVFSLNLSKDARGVLMEYLFSNDFRDETAKRNEYLEDLLKQGQDISLLPKHIFLPVEGNKETKKITVDLLIKIIRNPHIQYSMPVVWLATVMAYLLDLDLSDVRIEVSASFGERWNECVTSQRILDLKEEEYSLLEELVSILSTTKPILEDALCQDFSFEARLSILASVFLGLDKLRLSGIEHFKREQDKKSWSHKIEDLMKKITDAMASNGTDFRESVFGYPVYIYTFITFLFTKKLNEEEAASVFQVIGAVDPQLHPLVKPFLSAWGSLDKGERISL